MFSWLFKRSKKPPLVSAPAPVAAPPAFGEVFGANAARAPEKPPAPLAFPVGLPLRVAVGVPTPAFTVPARPQLVAAPPAAAPQAPAPQALAQQARALLEEFLANGQFREAEGLIARLPDTMDDEVWLMEGGLRLFVQLKHHELALQLAPRLREAAPDSPWGYLGAVPALRKAKRDAEADDLVRQALERCGESPELLVEGARLAERTGDTEAAVARWRRVVELSPDRYDGYAGLAQAGFQAKLHDAVAGAIEGGLARFPQDQTLRLIAARHSARLYIWPEAIRHWDLALAAAPNDRRLALEAATSLIGPPAGRQGRLGEVIGRLATMNRRFPEFAPAYTAHLDALRAAGRLEEATALGDAWRERFPADRLLWISCARVAEDRGLLGDAIAILAEARQAGEIAPDLEAAYVRALSLGGQDAQAERVCAAALARLTPGLPLIEQHVVLAMRRGDFEEAARRAAHWRGQRPDENAIARLADRVSALVDTGGGYMDSGAGDED